MAFDLPAALKSALERRTQGVSRADLARRAAALSSTYRGGGGSTVIRDSADALAYAITRMPATYAATAACLGEIARLVPDAAPAGLLDVGAGPGTATWAAAETFASLSRFAQLEPNAVLRALAHDLAKGTPRFAMLQQAAGGTGAIAACEGADLVVASYVLTEVPPSELASFAGALWQKTKSVLLLVEPGTPAGHARLMAARAKLLGAGAHMVAPCPHAGPCPLAAPDWCHFVQRLARSRDHKLVKGAEVPFEDEKFSYVAFARQPAAQRPAARVLAQPVVGKPGVSAKLCLADTSLRQVGVARRDKPAFAAARCWAWGDAVDDLGNEG
jgi:ribosomal protein RSM22 (predicted rRNA methylase)